MEKDLNCVTCGSPATGFFADNPALPLCSLITCEWALIDVLNGVFCEIAEDAKEAELEGGL